MFFDVISIFPEMFSALTNYGITRRAFENGKVSAKFWQLRDFADNHYKTIDGHPFGGGAGMVLLPEPLHKALTAIKTEREKTYVIYLSAAGSPLTHQKVMALSELPAITLICGRYEGIDQRIIDTEVDEEINLGDFVVSGGELPAMMLMDAVIRQLPGVIEADSLTEESFSINHQDEKILEYPHYTRPEEFNGLRVPEVLLSGHHQNIANWRREKARENTLKSRPELISK